ncbi:MAG: DUF1501 domain-containing protein [Planctomycetota bacterium]
MRLTGRREFLRVSATSAAVMTFGGLAPSPLVAAAMEGSTDRILVVIELAGGNDGLNTVVPFSDDAYYKARPELAIPGSDVLRIDGEQGLHPALRGFADLLESDRLAVVQNVGYPNPNQSHFESMDIWHTCQRKTETRTDGWLGRFFEHQKSGTTDPRAIHLGHDKQPFALMSRDVRVPSIRSLDQFRLLGIDDATFRAAVSGLSDAERPDDNDLLSFVQSSTSSAIAASERLGLSGRSNQGSVTYPSTQLGSQLKTVAQLIASGLTTSVYYLQLSGFDTHSQQPDAHAGLLRHLGNATKAFLDDMDELQQSDRVVVMAFSEFGRRVQQNASDGTDHGTAGPMFLAGRAIRSGLTGKAPDLRDLRDGDLVFEIDFRRVYASVLGSWFGSDPQPLLLGDYQPVDVFRSSPGG